MNWRRLASPAFIASMVTLCAGAAGMSTAIRLMHIVLHKKAIYPEGNPPRALRAIASETERWTRLGRDIEETPAVVEELGTENYLNRQYVEREPGAGAQARVARLHGAYYTGMIDTVPHVPDRCFVGAGFSLIGGPWDLDVPLKTGHWAPGEDLPAGLRGRVYTVRLAQDSTAGPGVRVNLPTDLTPAAPLQMRITEYKVPGGGHRFEGYFFIANGGWVANAERVRDKAFDATSEYAYYLKVQIGASDIGSAQELATMAGSLLDDLLGEVMTCVPDWVKVERGEWPPDNPRNPKLAGASGRR